MEIIENFSLKNYNTFGIEAYAKYFATFNSTEQLHELIEGTNFGNGPSLLLGGGSNILLRGNIPGPVLKNEIKAIKIIKEDADNYFVQVGAGENWHQFVLYCISQNMAGIENLSLIPGNVGAGPMQNIGAYGVELKDVFYELEAFHLREKKLVKFGLADCAFGYRESVFKTTYKNEFVITSVTFKLSRQPSFNTSYGAIEQELERMGVTTLNIAALSQAVVNIRTSKLPDPAIIGNAGSFFKNPEVTIEIFEALKLQFNNIVGYVLPNNHVKLAAGWLIEQCGWKGYRKGDAGCHAKQALVLVNYGSASGQEIYDLSTQILESVRQKFGVLLEREVNIF